MSGLSSQITSEQFVRCDNTVLGATKKAWRKLGFVVHINLMVIVGLPLHLYRMGQAAARPCRRGESYVTELYEWFRKFVIECPSGLITLHEFQRHFCDGTAGSESAEYAEQIFRTLDNNGDGVVDFREYVMAISMLIEGSAVEKLRWSFKLYDKDRDGAITKEEMLEIMQAVYKMNVAAGLTRSHPLTAEECTHRIFVRLDKDNNTIISLEEFIEGALDDDWIREMLECDPSIVKVERPLKRDTALETHG